MDKPLISVIVPIFKVEEYLRECIDSIISQIYSHLEIILVDDGSPDNCGRICDEYAQKDQRIIVIHKENGGLSDARNAGLDVFSGEYIAFIDSDDVIHPQFIETLYINIGKADLVFCDILNFFDHEKNSINVNLDDFVKREFSDKFLLKNITTFRNPLVIVAWNKMYKKQIWKNLRYPYGRIHEDEYVIHHILDKCVNVVFCDVKLYFYRQRSSSIMSAPSDKHFLDCIEMYNERENFYLEKEMFQEARFAYNHKFIRYLHPSVNKLNKHFKDLKFSDILLDRRLYLKIRIRLLTKMISPSFYHLVVTNH